MNIRIIVIQKPKQKLAGQKRTSLTAGADSLSMLLFAAHNPTSDDMAGIAEGIREEESYGNEEEQQMEDYEEEEEEEEEEDDYGMEEEENQVEEQYMGNLSRDYHYGNRGQQ
jgi:hypothetical protein